jgi:N-acetylmuramoyl-L-alanine amidase
MLWAGIFGLLGVLLLPSHASASLNTRGLTGVDIVSRTARWADETMRYATRPEYKKFLATKPTIPDSDDDTMKVDTKKTATDYVMAYFAGEFSLKKVWTKEWGKFLFRPLQIAKNKTKIIIHHTATNDALPTTDAQEKTYMQNTYTFHAFTRWWGDIGYNFVIMPSGKIYEGRKGGKNVVAAHASWNNTPSIGISLVGNFVDTEPTQAQIDALVALSTELARTYGIDPLKTAHYFRTSKIFPYVEVLDHPSIVGHTDAWFTACPWALLYALLDPIRIEVSHRLQWMTPMSVVVPRTPISAVNTSIPMPLLSYSTAASTQGGGVAPLSMRDAYMVAHPTVKPSSSSIKRLDGAPREGDIAKIEKSPVRVLLYEISAQNAWTLQCSPTCVMKFAGGSRTVSVVRVMTSGDQFLVTWGATKPTQNRLMKAFAISAGEQWIVTITDYARKTSDNIGLNTFRQTLLFAFGPMKYLDGTSKPSTPQIINMLSLPHYMRGIGEASDNQSQTKAQVLALLSKAYAMYYMGGAIRHPSIPEKALYNAIDDPRMFQKYVGAWWEQHSTLRASALSATEWKYLVYNSVLPILPYFHCSAGFTRSGNEKRGWKDTPYLASVADEEGSCGDGEFQGHGVGLSGKWASAMADAGKSVQDIIGYYYNGVIVR